MAKNLKIARTVILGIGNILLGDEGIGVHVVKRLREEKLPPDILVIDGSTAGFRLFPVFEDYRDCRFIIIDAINTHGASPKTPDGIAQKNTLSKGDLYVIPLEDLYGMSGPEYPGMDFISFHQTSVADVLNLFCMTYKIKISGYLIGVVISGKDSADSNFTFSMELSGKIKQKIPRIIDLVKKYIDY